MHSIDYDFESSLPKVFVRVERRGAKTDRRTEEMNAIVNLELAIQMALILRLHVANFLSHRDQLD
jgi:hypothetical protein